MEADASASEAQLARDKLSERPSLNVPDFSSPIVENSPDNKSEKEAAAIAAGTLDEAAKRNEHDRTEKFRDAVALAVLILFWIAFAAMVVATIIWFWHLITPPGWCHFLEEKQLDKIGNLLMGGITTSFLSNYAKKRLS